MIDAALLADIKAVRDSLARSQVLAFMGPDPFWEDVLDVIAATDPLPSDVLVVWTVMADPDPALANRGASHPQGVTQTPVSGATPGRELEQFDPLVLERVMRMAKRRQLRAYHTGARIAFTDAGGETRYSGTVAEVYEALKADTVAQLSPDPVERLRERLARVAGWNWTLEVNDAGFYTLTRNGESRASGTFEDISIIAESHILNTVPNRGYQLGYPE